MPDFVSVNDDERHHGKYLIHIAVLRKSLNLLRQNSRTKNTEIARQVSLTERAVRARIEKLVREGIIKRFTVETSPVGVEGLVLIGTSVGRTTSAEDRGG